MPPKCAFPISLSLSLSLLLSLSLSRHFSRCILSHSFGFCGHHNECIASQAATGCCSLPLATCHLLLPTIQFPFPTSAKFHRNSVVSMICQSLLLPICWLLQQCNTCNHCLPLQSEPLMNCDPQCKSSLQMWCASCICINWILSRNIWIVKNESAELRVKILGFDLLCNSRTYCSMWMALWKH